MARSYSKKRAQVSPSTPMETNYINPNPEAADQNTHLSGAYIVKQLTTSNSLSPSPSPSSSASPPPTPPKTHQKSQSNAPHKKQVRRRLHTTKPYQERLLNMAEARKEIVTALKFHRATMKQQQQQQQTMISPPQFQETSSFSATPTPELVLPNQTLGLNLSSFQDLTNLDAACLYSVTADDITSSMLPDAALTSPSAAPAAATGEQGLVGSRALGDLEMEEIKSIGEMHEMEWNDTLNLANSAWWFKFLSNEEFEQEFDNLSPTLVCKDRQFEQAVELPLCWEGNYDPNYSTCDGNFYQSRHLELPCMNIEDIEGLDEEWLC